MGGLTAKGNGVPLDSKGAQNGSEREIQIEQYRTLFDVQLDVSTCIAQFPTTLLEAFKIDPVLGQRIDQGNPILVFQPPGLLDIDMT